MDYYKCATEVFPLSKDDLLKHLLTVDGRGKVFKLAALHRYLEICDNEEWQKKYKEEEDKQNNPFGSLED